jgi:rubredoxin-NAD+ reductase
MSDDARALRRWLCEACGLVYDEARGDPDSGLAPGTRFEDIPEDWRCPVCGVGKRDFRPLEPAPAGGSAAAADRSPGALAASTAAPAAARGEGVVIVGAGAAGWGVARELRDAGHAGPITLVTACDGAFYPKPTLSVALARGLAPAAIVARAGPAIAAELGVRLIAHAWAVELDIARRRLYTTRGTLRYAALVLATGSRARRPALRGAGAARLFAVNDLVAYTALRAAYAAARERALAQGRAPRLAIVGAGLVGCELADDFAGAGAEVALLERGGLPLAGRLDAATGTRLRDALAGRGVRFHGEAVIDAVGVPETAGADDSPVELLWRDDGGVHNERFDLGLIAAGIDPEVRLAARAGLRVDRGIVVDPASLGCGEGLWALGDCAQVGDRVGGTVEPILRQARTIAGAIMGRPQPYEPRDPVWVVKTPSLPLTLRPSRTAAGPA